MKRLITRRKHSLPRTGLIVSVLAFAFVFLVMKHWLTSILISLPSSMLLSSSAAMTETSYDGVSSQPRSSSLQDYLSREKVAVRQCSEPEIDRITHRLWSPKRKRRPKVINRATSALSLESSCQDSTWIREYLLSAPRGAPFLGIFIGCNKGFDAVEVAHLGMRDQAFNKTQWISNFRAKSDAWAVCSQDREAQDVIIPSDKRIPGELHCIEPAEETTTILQQVSTNMGLHAHGFRIHNAALSNYTGTTKFVQSSTFAGAEHLSIHSCYNPAYQHMCKDVPVYTLDDYVVQFVENQDAPIDYLSIDAEGSDFDVLRGGVETLKRARYLEFEVLSTGTWAHHGVMQAIYFLHQDFICYWAGKGRLFRITDCVNHVLRSLYDRNYWANVACVNRREKDLIERMEKIFRETLDMPPKI